MLHNRLRKENERVVVRQLGVAVLLGEAQEPLVQSTGLHPRHGRVGYDVQPELLGTPTSDDAAVVPYLERKRRGVVQLVANGHERWEQHFFGG